MGRVGATKDSGGGGGPLIDIDKIRRDIIAQRNNRVQREDDRPAAQERELPLNLEQPLPVLFEVAETSKPELTGLAEQGAKALLAQGLQIDDKLFAHIHGDSFISGTDLEGNKPVVTLDALLKIIQASEDEYGQSALSDSLEQAKQVGQQLQGVRDGAGLRAVAKDLSRQLGQLEPGKALLLPGGWSNSHSTGHLMLYQLERDQDGSYSFVFYNTGSGVEAHGMAVEDLKIVGTPLMKLKGIDAQRACDPAFVEALLDPVVRSHIETVNNDFQASEIYDFVQKWVGGQLIELEAAPEDYITLQRAGTCSWKALMAYMRQHMDQPNYKRFVFALKRDTLAALLEQSSLDALSQNATRRDLMANAAERLAARALRAFAAGHIDQTQLSNCAQLVRLTVDRVLEADDVALQRLQHGVEALKLDCLPPRFGKLRMQLMRMDQGARLDSSKAKAPAWLDSQEPPLPEKSQEALVVCLEYLDQLREGKAPHGLQREYVLRTLKDILVRSEFFSDIPGQNSEAAMQLIDRLYCRILAIPNDGYAEQWAVLEGLQLAQHQLGCRHPTWGWLFKRYSINKGGTYQKYHFFNSSWKELGDLLDQPTLQVCRFAYLDHRTSTWATERENSPTFYMDETDYLYDKEKGWDYNRERFAKSVALQFWNELLATRAMRGPISEYFKGQQRPPDQEILAELFKDMSGKLTPLPIALMHKMSFLKDKPQIFGPLLRSLGVDCPTKKLLNMRSDGWSKDVKVTVGALQQQGDDKSRWTPRWAKVEDKDLQNQLIAASDDRHHYPYRESKLMGESAAFPNMSPSETHEFRLAAQQPSSASSYGRSDMQLIEVIHLFSGEKGPAYFGDPIYRQLLERVLSQHLAIARVIRAEPELAAKLADCLQRAKDYYDTFPLNDRVQPQLFVARMSWQIRQLLPQYELDIPDTLPKHGEIYERLLELCQAPDLRVQVLTELCASFGGQTELSDDDIVQLVRAYIGAGHIQRPLPDEDPQQGPRADRSLFRWRSEVFWRMHQNPKLVDRIGVAVMRDAGLPPPAGEWTLDEGILRNREWQVMMNGRISHASEVISELPLKVVQDPRVVASGLSVEKARKEILADGSLQFSLAEDFRVTVSSDFEQIRYARKIDGQWYRLNENRAARDDIASAVGAKHLVYNCDLWVPEEGQAEHLLLLEKKGAAKLRVELEDGRILAVLREDPSPLSLVDIYSRQGTKGADVLQHIERLGCINVWAEPGSDEMSLLELPRFACSFQVCRVEGRERAVWNSDTDWFIASKPTISALGDFDQYLALENSAGQRRVLIAREPLGPSPELRDGEQVKRNFIAFDYDPIEKQLSSKTIEGQLYLCYLALSRKDYDQAQLYLSQTQNYVRAYKPREREIMDWIMNLKPDMHPKAVAIRLRMIAMDGRNAAQFPHGKGSLSLDPQAISESYDVYLGLSHNIPRFQLGFAEEFALLRTLNTNKIALSPQQKVRLKQLEGEVESTLHALPKPPLQGLLPRETLGKEDWAAIAAADDKYAQLDWDKLSLTRFRPADALTYFRELYNVARDPAHPHHQRLRIMMHFLAVHTQFWNSAGESTGLKLGRFLHAVLESREPQSFAPLPRLPKFSYSPSGLGYFSSQESARARHQENISKILSQFFETARARLPAAQANKERAQQGATILPGEFKELRVEALLRQQIEAELPKGKELIKLEPVDPYEAILSHAKGDLAEIKEVLEKDKADELEALALFRAEIEELANSAEDEALAQAQKALRVQAGQHPVLKLDDLMLPFLQGRYEDFYRLTGLPAPKIEQLNQNLLAYFSRYRRIQHRERVLKMIAISETVDSEAQRARFEQLARDEIIRKPHYHPHEHRDYLILEVDRGFLLRDIQVEELAKLTSDEREYLVVHLNMGAGKSSTLGPLWGLSVADGKTLPLFVVPRSLYATNREELRQLSQSALGQKIYSFDFDRQFDVVDGERQDPVQRLHHMYQELLEVISGRGCCIATKESLQALELRYFEYLEAGYAGSEGESDRKVVELLGKMLDLFGGSCKALIDEVDSELDTAKELNFTLGEPRPVDPVHIDAVMQLYRILCSDPKLQALSRVRDKNKHEFSDEEIAQILDGLAEIIAANPRHQLDDDQQVQLVSFLRDRSIAPTATIRQHPNYREFCVQRGELTRVLGNSLRKIYDEHFGFERPRPGEQREPDTPLAIPYSANKEPNRFARHGNHYLTINCTIQAYLKEGIDWRIAQKWVKSLQAEVGQQMLEDFSLRLKDCAAYQEFRTYCPKLDLFEVNSKSDLEAVAKVLSGPEHSLKLLDLVSAFVLQPELKLHGLKLSHNAQNLIEIPKAAKGFSGTPDNYASYHPRMITERKAAISASTRELILKECKGKIHVIKSDSAEAMLDEMLERFYGKDSEFSVHIDPNNQLCGLSSEEAARRMHAHYRKLDGQIQGVVYVDHNNERQVLQLDSDQPIPFSQCKLPPEARATRYDDNHCTGTHITQHPTAKALITVPKTRRDFDQALWRMRGLPGQSVELVITEDQVPLITQGGKRELNIEAVVDYLEQNQKDALAQDTYQATFHKIDNYVRRACRAAILAAGSYHEKVELYAKLRNEIMTFVKDEPTEQFGPAQKDRDPLVVLDEYRRAAIGRVRSLSALSEKQRTAVELELERFELPAKEQLPKQVQRRDAGAADLDSEQLIQVEVEQRVEVEVEQEVEREIEVQEDDVLPWSKARAWGWNVDILAPETWTISDASAPSAENRPDIYEASAAVSSGLEADYSKIFDSDLLVTNNFFHISEDSDDSNDRRLTPFGPQQIEVHQLLVLRDPDKPDNPYRLVVGDLVDVDAFVGHLRKNRADPPQQGRISRLFYGATKRLHGCVFDPLIGIVQHGHERIEEAELKQDPRFLRLLVQAKFLNGDGKYTRSELVALEEWMREVGAQRLVPLFKQIIAARPEKLAGFATSDIARVFAKLAK